MQSYVTCVCSDADEAQTAVPLLLGSQVFSKAFLDSNPSVVALHPSPSSPTSAIPPFAAALSASFSSSHCTFAATSFRHAYQLWRPCYTCNLIDSNGCCSLCAHTCHAGHHLGEERFSNFFCDCGSRGPSFCQCLEDPSTLASPSHQHRGDAASSASTAVGPGAGVGALLSPESLLDVSGGLFAGSPPVDIGQLASAVLSTNQQLFQSDSLSSLPSAVREAAVQTHARLKRRRQEKEKRQKTSQDRSSETRRRGESFALSAFAACMESLEEMKEDNEPPTREGSASSPILLAVSHFLLRQAPYSMRLPSSQRHHFDLLLRTFCYSALSRRSSPAASAAAADSALRLWLTVGGVSERLEAALFLVELHQQTATATPLPLPISSFISSAVREGRRRQRRILRTARSSHASELSSRAVRLSIDLICSSLALIPPVPTSSAASLASATASTHVTSGSVSQTTGVFPSLTSSTDGDFLFCLSAAHGLVKLGTGQGSTVVGELVEQNPWLALHAGGHLVCVRDGESDLLLLRSPLLPPHRLLSIDCSTLQVTGSMSLPSTDGGDAEAAYAFDVEHELVSSTPSASTTPHWQPLAPVLMTSTDFTSLSSNAYSLIQQCIATSQWKLGEPFSLSSVVSLVVLTGGIFLVIDQGQQPPIQYRLRLRTQKRPMPLLPDQRQAQREDAAPTQFVSFTDRTPPRVQTFRRRAGDDGKVMGADVSEWQLMDEADMDDYHHALPAPQPSLPTTAASGISAPSTPATAPTRPCDGCGIVDWRREDRFNCLDGCVGLSLCSWCVLHQRFNSTSHGVHHHMDHLLPSPTLEPVKTSATGLLLSELAGGLMYWDGARLVLFPPRLPSSTLRHWRDFAPGDIVDVKDLYHKWYQADILAVNAEQKTVMVHYHGWHQKWDEWIDTALDRFAPRGSLSSQNKSPSQDSSSVKPDPSHPDASKRSVPTQQGARVLDFTLQSERVSHLTDVVVRSRCQAFVSQLPTGQQQRRVWGISEDGVLEQWEDESSSTAMDVAAADESLTPLAAATLLVESMPTLSVDSDVCKVQMSVTFSLLKAAWSAHLAAQSAASVEQSEVVKESASLVCAALDGLRRLLNYCRRTMPALLGSNQPTPELLSDLSYLCLTALSLSQQTDDPTVTDERIASRMLSLLVDGIDLFFPTWPARLGFVHSLAARPSPAHLKAIQAVDERYHAVHSGRLVDSVHLDGGDDHQSLFSPVAVDRMLVLLGQAEPRLFSFLPPAAATSATIDSSPPVHLVLVFLSQLYCSLQLPPPTVVAKPPAFLLQNEADTRALPAFLSLSTAVLRQAISILDHQPQGNESTPFTRYTALSSSPLFQILRPLLSWLPVVLDELPAAERPLYVELDQLLHPLVLLICKLSAASAAPAPPVSLPSLICSLRDSRQLTAAHLKDEVVHRTLVPFARTVLTSVFHCFASTVTGPPPTAVMSFDDFLHYYIHCHIPLVSSTQPPSASPAAVHGGPSSSHAVMIPISGGSNASTGATAASAAPSLTARMIQITGGPGDSESRVPVTFVHSGGGGMGGATREAAVRQAMIALAHAEGERQQRERVVSINGSSAASAAEASAAWSAGREMARNAVVALISAEADRQRRDDPVAPAGPTLFSQPSPLEPPRGSLPALVEPTGAAPPLARLPASDDAARGPVVMLMPSIPPPASSKPQSAAQMGRSLAPPVSPTAAVALQARLVFQKILATCAVNASQTPSAPSATSAVTGGVDGHIDLASFLRYQLEMSKADEKAVLEQLRVLHVTYDWSRQPPSAATSTSVTQSPIPSHTLTVSAVLEDLKVVCTRALAHLYPAPAIVHSCPHPASDSPPSVVSISSLPGVVLPPSAAGEGVGVSHEEMVGRLLQSQAHWIQHPEHEQRRMFLERFISRDADEAMRERLEREVQRQAKQRKREERAQRMRWEKEEAQRLLSTPKPTAVVSPEALELTAAAFTHSPQEMGSRVSAAGESMVAIAVDVAQSLKENDESRQKAQHDRRPSGESDTVPITRSSDDEVEERRLKALQDEKRPDKFDLDVQPSRDVEAPQQPIFFPSPSPSPSPSPVPLTSDSAIPLSDEIEEPSLCLSTLFLRCLSELGGGLSKRRIEEWKAALSAEKAYGAALIKHHGMTDRAIRYSNSIQIVELLREAVAPNSRVRCLSHPSCPQWFRSVVQATFRDVRSPLLAILRQLDEGEETAEASEPAVTTEQLRGEEEKEASGPARGDERTPAVVPPPLSPLAAASKLVDRISTNCHFLVRQIDAIELDVHSSLAQRPHQKVPAGDQSRDEGITAASPDGGDVKPRVSFGDTASSITSVVSDDSVSSPPSGPLPRRGSSFSNRRRHSLLSIQPTAQLDLQHFTAETVGQGESDASDPTADAALTEAEQEKNADLSMARSFSTHPAGGHRTRPSHSHHGSISSSPLWSLSPSAEEAFLSQPFDSSWLSALVHSESTLELQGSLRPTIQRYHSVALLRLRLLQSLNEQFARGHQRALVEHVVPLLLPALSRSKPQVHLLLYNSRLLLKEEDSQAALLSFFKHIVRAINDPSGDAASSATPTASLPLSYSASGWLTLRRCLHLCNLRFTTEDASTVVGSGLLSALSRWMSRIDAATDRLQWSRAADGQASLEASGQSTQINTRVHTRSSSRIIAHAAVAGKVRLSSSSLVAAFHLRYLMWQTYKLLSLFYLAVQQQQQLDSLQVSMDATSTSDVDTSPATSAFTGGENVVLETLGSFYLSTLLANLRRLEQMGPRLSLDREDGLLSQTVDAGRMLLHFARLPQSICSPSQLSQLLIASRAAPPTTAQAIVQVIGYELGKLTPKEVDQHFSDNEAAGSAAASQVTSASSFAGLLLSELSRRVEGLSCTQSLELLSSLLVGRSSRLSSVSALDGGDRKQPELPLRIDEEDLRRRAHGRGSAKRPSMPHPSALDGATAEAASQGWMADDQVAFNPALCAVVEELILVIRSLCQERQWRRLLLPQLIQAALHLPSLVEALSSLAEAEAAAQVLPATSELIPQLPRSLGALAVLGGWSFTLRTGAYVEVSMTGDFPSSLAAPSVSALLSSLKPTAVIRRGFVQSFDLSTQRATVLISTSQPRFPVRPYRTGDAAGGAQLPLADARRVDFSFDQLRTIPAVSAPNLNDAAAFDTLWAALRAALSASTRPPSTAAFTASRGGSAALQDGGRLRSPPSPHSAPAAGGGCGAESDDHGTEGEPDDSHSVSAALQVATAVWACGLRLPVVPHTRSHVAVASLVPGPSLYRPRVRPDVQPVVQPLLSQQLQRGES